MSQHAFGARAIVRGLTGLDFGLRVRLEVRSSQRSLFPGAEDPSVQGLTAEVAEIVSSLRVFTFALRGQLEQVASALILNVEGGSWGYARRAALDLAGLLSQAAKRGHASRRLSFRGANAALRIADLCSREVR